MGEIACKSCGSQIAPGARFCSNCGTQLVMHDDARSRFMTVMFCDLADSTSMTESVGDEAMYGLISRFQQICNDLVIENGGYVAKFMGDGMLAYFGYPEAVKNSSAAAVRTAHQVIERLRTDATAGGRTLSASAGVATGWMVVGDARASSSAAETMAIGRTVNLASRLQGFAGPGQVAVSEDASRRLEPREFALRPLGQHPIKGMSAPMNVWLAAPVPAAESCSVFVGRGAFRQQLAQIWAEARTSGLRIAEIVAPGGYGKTKLAAAFLEDVRAESTTLELRAEQHRRQLSFASLRPFVRQLAGLAANAPQPEQKARIVEWAPEGLAPGLHLLLGLDDGTTPPLVRQARIAQAVRGLFDLIVPHGPSVLLVEDAHWLDADTLAILRDVAADLAGRQLLILTTRRPEGAEMIAPDACRIDLGRMADEEAMSMVAAIDRIERIAPRQRGQIVTRAAGVPLFIEHFTMALMEREGDVTDLAAPLTMVEALTERFDSVGDGRAMVEAAAILGSEIRLDVLAAMLDRSPNSIAGLMTELFARGLFAPGPDGSVLFDHALIRDAVIGTLLKAQTTRLHTLALEAYRAIAPDHLAAEPTLEAYHLLGAGQPAAAIPKGIEAARVALSRGEIAEAVRLARRALQALPDVPPGEVRDTLEVLIWYMLGQALGFGRGYSDQEVVECYNRAVQLFPSAKVEPEVQIQIAWGIYTFMIASGDAEGTDQITLRIAEVAGQAQDPIFDLVAASALSLQQLLKGNLAAAERCGRRVRELYDFATHRVSALTYNQDFLLFVLANDQHVKFLRGDLPGWQAVLAETRAHEDALGLKFLMPYMRVWGLSQNTYADPDDAYRPMLLAAIDYAIEAGQPFWHAGGLLWLARARTLQEGAQSGIEDLQTAVFTWRAVGIGISLVLHEGLLALSYATVGRADEARAMMDHAFARFERGQDLLYRPEVLRLRAEMTLVLDPDNTAAAMDDLDAADHIAGEQGAPVWSALVAATRARIMACEIGWQPAADWLDRQIAALATSGSEEHPAYVTARRRFRSDTGRHDDAELLLAEAAKGL
jgi:class 3 adenylate cyclase